MSDPFKQMLTGGHPNSLERTKEVAAMVLAAPDRMVELFDCYKSPDKVVRLHVSNASRRVQVERSDLLFSLIDRLPTEIGELNQLYAQWTLLKLYERTQADTTARQHTEALGIVKRKLAKHNDWIAQNYAVESLTHRAASDQALKAWLIPYLERLSADPRKSVVKRSGKALHILGSSKNV